MNKSALLIWMSVGLVGAMIAGYFLLSPGPIRDIVLVAAAILVVVDYFVFIRS
jgi:hypothetical protein